jgi:NarL family two-component system response regulator LiaR
MFLPEVAFLPPDRLGSRATTELEGHGRPPSKDEEATVGQNTDTEVNPGGNHLRAVVADDDPFARRVIKEVLQGAGVRVIAEAANGRQAVEYTLYYRPDVVVMDVVMPELDGIMATRQIVKQIPDQLIIVLTGAGDEDGELGLQALRAGATGFLSKDVDIDALPRALEGVHAGEAAISRKMTKQLIERLRRAPSGASGMRPVKSPLTAREWEVIDLLKAELSTEQIADELVLSTETVRSHVKNILRKLNVRSREDAVAAADRTRSTAPNGGGTGAAA